MSDVKSAAKLSVTALILILQSISSISFAPQSQANTLANSSPAAGAVLVVAPTAVSVTATNPLLADGSQLSVVDPTGKAVDDGNISVTDSTVLVGMKSLTATGVYTVTYTLLAQGDQPLNGSFTFLYNAPDQISSATPTPITTASATKSSGSSIFSGATLFVLVIFAAGCAMLAFLIWYARTLIHQAQKRKRKAAKKVTAPSRRRD